MEQSERLKAVRDYYGLNMRDFAERLGMSHGAISLLESGKRGLTSQFISAVCKEYGVNDEWLRDGEGEMFKPKDREDEIAEWADQLLDEVDPSIKKELVRIIMKLDKDQLELLKDIALDLADALGEK